MLLKYLLQSLLITQYFLVLVVVCGVDPRSKDRLVSTSHSLRAAKQDGGLQDSECATLPLRGRTVSLSLSQDLMEAFWGSHMDPPAHDSKPVCRG